MGQATPSPGSTYLRGEPGYEDARRASSWNARTPDRYPDVIIQANHEQDVINAVRRASRENLRIAICSGGHSWAGNHLRDGGMLIDVSRLNGVSIDKPAMRAVAGPGCKGHELALLLARQNLFFPAGHCKGVCLGGYLLQGGFGWHSRALGPACMSVAAIDYVDAGGVMRHASERENADMLWAARGAGPGFFGVVTRFHLRLYPRPPFLGLQAASYHADHLEELVRWAHAAGPEVPSSIELMMLMSRDTPFVRGVGIELVAPVFENSYRDARRAFSFMEGRPRGAALALPLLPIGLGLLYNGVMRHYPSPCNYAVDNMWTHATADELMPGLKHIAATLPSSPSHMLWMNWAPPPDRPNMAFSMEDTTYIALYGGWNNPTHETAAASWARDRMSEMAHLASGCQLADENLGQRPARFMAQPNLERLDALRKEYDPHSRFHPWMGRP